MAFNINAQVILSGPKNIKSVTKNIKKQLGGLTATVNIKVPKGTASGLRALNQHVSTLNASLGILNSRAKTATSSVNTLSTSLKTATSHSSKLSKVQSSVNKSLTNTNKNLAQTNSQLNQFGKEAALAIRRFAAFTVATSVIFGFIRAVQNATKEALNFQREVVRLTQVTGVGGKDLDQFKRTVDSLSVSLGIDANQLAKIAVIFAQTGQSVDQVQKSLKAVARSSLAPTFGTMESTAEGLIAAMEQFNISADKSEQVLSALNAVSKKFAVESGDLISVIRRAGGVFSQSAGQFEDPIESLNQLIGIFTAVRSTTRETADTIAVGLRTIFTRIQRPRTIDFLRDFGIELTDAQDRFIGFQAAFQALSTGLKPLFERQDTLTIAKIVEELGGIRQVGKLIPAITQFNKALDATRIAGEGAAEGLGKDVALALQPLGKQFEQLDARFRTFVRSVAESKTFQNLANLAIKTASAFLTMAEGLKPLLPLITTLATIKISRGIFDFGAGFIGGFKRGGGAKGVGAAAGGAVTGQTAQQQAASQQKIIAATQALTTTLKLNNDRLRNNTQALIKTSGALGTINSSLAKLGAQLAQLPGSIAASRGFGFSTGPKVTGFAGGRGRKKAGGRIGFNTGGRALSPGGAVIPKDYAGVFLQAQGTNDALGPANLTQSKSVSRKSVAFNMGDINRQLTGKLNLGRAIGSTRIRTPGGALERNLGIKLSKGNQFPYDLHTASLSPATNNKIFRNIKASVIVGIRKAAKSAQKETGTRALKKVDEGLLKQIGFRNIAGRMFEGVLGRMGAPYDNNRDPGADFDFPAGLGTLATAFGLPASMIGDAKLTDNPSNRDSIDKKVKNFILSRFKAVARSRVGAQGGMSQGNIPSLLEPGEVVVSPQGVSQGGLNALASLNKKGDASRLGDISPSNVAVVPGSGRGDTFPADIEPGSYVIRRRFAGALAARGNVTRAATGGMIGRARFNGGGMPRTRLPEGFQLTGATRRTPGPEAGLGWQKATNEASKATKEDTKATEKHSKALKKQTKMVKNFGGSLQGIGFGALALTGTLSTLDVEGQGWLKSSMQMAPALALMTSGFDTSADSLKRTNINARKQARSMGFGRGVQRGVGATAAGGKQLMGRLGMAGIGASLADPLVGMAQTSIMGAKQTGPGGVQGRAGQSVNEARTEGALASGASGALGGAAVGAAIGSVIPVLGTAVGAAVGAAIGGVGGLVIGGSSGAAEQERFLAFGTLNSDAEQLSKSFEKLTKATNDQERSGAFAELSDAQGKIGKVLSAGGGFKGARTVAQTRAVGRGGGQTITTFKKIEESFDTGKIKESLDAFVKLGDESKRFATNSSNQAKAINSFATSAASGTVAADKLAGQMADVQAATAITAIDTLAVDIHKLGPSAKGPINSLAKFTSALDGVAPESKDTLHEIIQLAAGMDGLSPAILKSLLATKNATVEQLKQADVMALAAKATKEANKEIFAWAVALDQASSSLQASITKVNREISNSETAFNSLFSVTTNVPNIKAAGLSERRGLGTRNVEERNADTFEATLANISDFQKGLPQAIQTVTQQLEPGAQPSATAEKVVEAAGGVGAASDISKFLQQGIREGIKGLGTARRQQGGQAPFVKGQLEGLLREGGTEDIEGMVPLGDKFNKVAEDIDKGGEVLRESFIKIANMGLELNRKRIENELNMLSKEQSIRDRISKVTGVTQDPVAQANQNLSRQLGSITAGTGVGDAAQAALGGDTKALANMRRGLEETAKNLRDQAAGGANVVSELHENSMALEAVKRSSEVLSNDMTRLSALEQQAASAQARGGRAQSGILAFSKAIGELQKGNVKAFNEFTGPLRTLVKATQGKGLAPQETEGLISAMESGDPRIAGFLDALPEQQGKALKENLVKGLVQRRRKDLLQAGGDAAQFEPFLAQLETQFRDALDTRSDVAKEMEKIGNTQISLMAENFAVVSETAAGIMEDASNNLEKSISELSDAVIKLAQALGQDVRTQPDRFIREGVVGGGPVFADRAKAVAAQRAAKQKTVTTGAAPAPQKPSGPATTKIPFVPGAQAQGQMAAPPQGPAAIRQAQQQQKADAFQAAKDQRAAAHKAEGVRRRRAYDRAHGRPLRDPIERQHGPANDPNAGAGGGGDAISQNVQQFKDAVASIPTVIDINLTTEGHVAIALDNGFTPAVSTQVQQMWKDHVNQFGKATDDPGPKDLKPGGGLPPGSVA